LIGPRRHDILASAQTAIVHEASSKWRPKEGSEPAG